MRHGLPIEDYELPIKVDAGIVLPNIGQMIPEYEEREAAVYTHCDWLTWQQLDWYDRAASVAQYRIHHLIDAHMQDASEKAAKRAQRRSKK